MKMDGLTTMGNYSSHKKKMSNIDEIFKPENKSIKQIFESITQKLKPNCSKDLKIKAFATPRLIKNKKIVGRKLC